MSFDWNDYSADSDTEDVSLLISVRSQSLILAAMRNLDSRASWLEVDDSTWDDIDAAIGEAYEEIMETVMPDFTPVGAIMAWWTDTPPDKWLLCDGTSVDSDDYPALAAVIGDTGGLVVLPDFTDRFLFGAGINDDVRDLGGENEHILTVAEMPAHTHDILRRGGLTGAATALDIVANSVTPTLSIAGAGLSNGGGAAHNNIPAYVAVNWIIKALP